MDDKFDCIIVGGGVAGLSAAMTLARANCKFLLIERGEFCGAKNVSGGVLWGTDLARLVPGYWEDAAAGFERFVRHRRLTLMDGTAAFSLDFKSDHFDETPYQGLIVLRAKFDEWLAGKVQEAIDASDYAADSLLATNVLVEEVIQEQGKVVGIRTGEEVFHADCVILAEGVNNLLTRQVGLQKAYVPADHMAVGVKEVIRLGQQVLEDRFQLTGRAGLTNEFVGAITQGVEGGGFLYTNHDSVSLGLVLGMKDLREKRLKPYDVLNTFKQHSAVRDMIRGGEVIEYSAHAVSLGYLDAVPKALHADGVMVVGEAANLLMSVGKAIQGMDYAMRSGILAAETVVAAKHKGDFSATTLQGYRTALDQSYVMQDMRAFQNALHVIHSPQMFGMIPNLVCDFGRQFFSIGNTPTPKTSQMLQAAIKRHSSYWELLKFGFRAGRAL